MIEAFRKYNQSGFVCLPVRRDKRPLLTQSWNDGFSEEYFKKAEGIGIVCGKKSGGLECLDFDNHFFDAKSNLTKYLAVPDVYEIYKKYQLPVEKTQNGGYHLLFRCEYNDGNKKLASRVNDRKIPEAIIETRGEGGYFVAAPTPGYNVVRNDIYTVNKISIIERAILIDNAIALNEFTQIIRNEYESGDRPGDMYNRSSGAVSEVISLLRSSGWQEVTSGRWRRPDKKDGISATLGKVADNVFYVFSSNAYPFENNKGYLPFQVLALLKFNGDFKAAAESLPKPEKIKTEIKPYISESEIEKILNQSKIDINKTIDRPPTILSILEAEGTRFIEKRLFTLGNFSCIIGRAKSKKTFFLTMVTASLINQFTEKLKGTLPENKRTILYFDTEQGDYDSFKTIKRINHLSGDTSNLMAFNLRPYSPHERCQIIEFAFSKWGYNTGFCVIDGVADLSNGINDEDEATRVATMLLRLTKVNNCHISTVIHQNKNDNFATGHLGSAITKKAEIIISVVKDNSNRSNSEVNCDMSRGVDFEPFSFTITQEGLPEIIGNKSISTQISYYEKEFNDPEYVPF